MPGDDNNANAPAATGASKMLAMLPKITKWVTSGDANALSHRNCSSWRAARINSIMALTALSFWNVLLKIGEKANPPVGDLVVVDGLGAASAFGATEATDAEITFAAYFYLFHSLLPGPVLSLLVHTYQANRPIVEFFKMVDAHIFVRTRKLMLKAQRAFTGNVWDPSLLTLSAHFANFDNLVKDHEWHSEFTLDATNYWDQLVLSITMATSSFREDLRDIDKTLAAMESSDAAEDAELPMVHVQTFKAKMLAAYDELVETGEFTTHGHHGHQPGDASAYSATYGHTRR